MTIETQVWLGWNFYFQEQYVQGFFESTDEWLKGESAVQYLDERLIKPRQSYIPRMARKLSFCISRRQKSA